MPNWLTYYFAVDPGEMSLLLRNGVKCNVLVSYAFFKGREEVAHKLTDQIKAAGKRLMLDSGAFSNVQRPGTVSLEQYEAYLKEHRKRWTEYVTFDDLCSRDKTIRQHEALLARGHRPLFVDHMRMREDERVLKYWKRDDKVALGAFGVFRDRSAGAAGYKQQRNPHEALHKKAEDGRKLKTTVHLLAVSSLTRFLHHADVISSVDSAAWGRSVAFGKVLVAERRDVGGVQIPILARYDHPRARVRKRPMTPRVRELARAFVSKRKWSTSGVGVYKLFALEQIEVYVKALNSMSPQTIVEAVKRHKAEKEAAEMTNRRYYFLDDDAGEDAWSSEDIAKRGERSAAFYDLETVSASVLCCAPDLELPRLHARAHAGDTLLAEQHLLIVQEMAKRGMPHAFKPGALLDWSTKSLGEQIGLCEAELSELGLIEKQMVLQTIILSKVRFETAAAAKKWITDHNFAVKAGAPDETGDSWRFRQREPGEFEPGTFRTISMTDGVKAVVGQLKESKREKQAADEPDAYADVRLLPVEKADEDRRIVLGVVLEPNSVDTQGDTISPDEIEHAAHRWLAKYQDRGFMHRQIVNGKIEIYESYLAPVNLTLGGQKVKKGTWLLMYHVLDDDLWSAIKRGDMTGFSMGGFARRTRV
jgi:hypothetical protein